MSARSGALRTFAAVVKRGPSARKRPRRPADTAAVAPVRAAPPAPAAWEAVTGPQGTYYWNPATDETTAIGEPNPAHGGLRRHAPQQQQQQVAQPMQQQGMSFGETMKHSLISGASMTVAFVAVAAVFRAVTG